MFDWDGTTFITFIKTLEISKLLRQVIRTLSDIYDGVFLQK